MTGVQTCALPISWKNLIQPMTAKQGRLLHRVEEESGVTVAGFNKEESEKAYRMYQELYQMRTPFAEIDPRVALRLRDPLVLKITGSNYLGKALSADTNDYTSLRLFEHLTQEIGNSYAGRMQCEIIDCIAEYMLSCRNWHDMLALLQTRVTRLLDFLLSGNLMNVNCFCRPF